MVEPQLVIMLSSLGALAYLYYKYKKGVGQELIIAALISFAWVTWSGIYDYEGVNYVYFGINLFPLIAWTTGLVILREIYEKIKGKQRFLIVSGLYIGGLLVVEYIGFNFLGIQVTGDYTGLFNLELLHAPMWGKIFYLTLGPIYLSLTDYLGVK